MLSTAQSSTWRSLSGLRSALASSALERGKYTCVDHAYTSPVSLRPLESLVELLDVAQVLALMATLEPWTWFSCAGQQWRVSPEMPENLARCFWRCLDLDGEHEVSSTLPTRECDDVSV